MSSYTATWEQTQELEAGSVSPESESEWPPEAVVNLHLLARGVRWALAIEGVAALSVYVVWYLWRRLL
ncbi:MAG: hypothetical protein ABSF23_05790 [Terracidiphilus sp.]|jgi:hypothetical protein